MAPGQRLASMMNRSFYLLILVMSLLAGPSMAAHITDKLVVGLYPEPKAEGNPLQLLSSGTPLDVLERKDGFAEVRLADDTKGWVEAGYITEEKPAKAMLLETQAKMRQMGLELAKLRDEASADTGRLPGDIEAHTDDLAKAAARIEELESALAEARAAESAVRELDALNDAVQQAIERLAATQGLTLQSAKEPIQSGNSGTYLPWLSALVTLLIGFIVGILFIDYRIRRRYGGFRIWPE